MFSYFFSKGKEKISQRKWGLYKILNRLKKIRKTQWDEIRRDLVFITKIYFVCLKYYIWKHIFGGPSRFPLLWLSIIVILLLSKAEVLYHNLDLLVMCVLLSLLLLLWTVITGICWDHRRYDVRKEFFSGKTYFARH